MIGTMACSDWELVVEVERSRESQLRLSVSQLTTKPLKIIKSGNF